LPAIGYQEDSKGFNFNRKTVIHLRQLQLTAAIILNAYQPKPPYVHGLQKVSQHNEILNIKYYSNAQAST
jgi:hypothetical protein